MQVQDLMNRTVRTCGPDESLDVAARLMWENDVGCVPVTDESMHPLAMLTDRDTCMAALTQGRALRDIPVRTAMSTSLYVAAPGETLGFAEELMRRHQVRRLPVVDDSGCLVGLISMNDIAREALRERPRHKHAVSCDEVATTLAAICRPRVCAIPAHEGVALAT